MTTPPAEVEPEDSGATFPSCLCLWESCCRLEIKLGPDTLKSPPLWGCGGGIMSGWKAFLAGAVKASSRWMGTGNTGQLVRPIQEGEGGTEQVFGWCLPPAPALETTSEGKGAKGKQGRKKSPSRPGDSLSCWVCLSVGIWRDWEQWRAWAWRTRQIPAGSPSLLDGSPFILLYLWFEGYNPPIGATKQSLRCPGLGSPYETLFLGPSALGSSCLLFGKSPSFLSCPYMREQMPSGLVFHYPWNPSLPRPLPGYYKIGHKLAALGWAVWGWILCHVTIGKFHCLRSSTTPGPTIGQSRVGVPPWVGLGYMFPKHDFCPCPIFSQTLPLPTAGLDLLTLLYIHIVTLSHWKHLSLWPQVEKGSTSPPYFRVSTWRKFWATLLVSLLPLN